MASPGVPAAGALGIQPLSELAGQFTPCLGSCRSEVLNNRVLSSVLLWPLWAGIRPFRIWGDHCPTHKPLPPFLTHTHKRFARLVSCASSTSKSHLPSEFLLTFTCNFPAAGCIRAPSRLLLFGARTAEVVKFFWIWLYHPWRTTSLLNAKHWRHSDESVPAPVLRKLRVRGQLQGEVTGSHCIQGYMAAAGLYSTLM